MELQPGSDGEQAKRRDANRAALDALYPEVYEELRHIAHRKLRQAWSGGTLNTTALVHEVYLRLSDQTQQKWKDRRHFFALASRAMRYIIIDGARAHAAKKRGGPGHVDLPLESLEIAADDCATDLIVLDEALEQLSRNDERLGQLIEYRFFGGLTYEEIAEATGVSVPTVKRDWRRARSWLLYRMSQS
jgi:RNA polymerase sigma factor (TIGR02999 family)